MNAQEQIAALKKAELIVAKVRDETFVYQSHLTNQLAVALTEIRESITELKELQNANS